MAGRVAGKVAVVTGAARGIGRGIAEILAQEGARVIIGDLLEQEGEATAAAIRDAGGEARFQRADVTQEGQCAALMETAVREYGRLDVLVNNAGYYPRASLEETTTELWEQILAINLRSVFYCCKYAVPHMREAGGGSICNIGSINGIQGTPNLVAYSAAKGGVLTMTRTLAGALTADRIRVNYLIPGWVVSEGEIAIQAAAGMSEKQLRDRGSLLPLGRHQTPRDAAYAALYLVSDESAQVTGAILNVDAGSSMLPMQASAAFIR